MTIKQLIKPIETDPLAPCYLVEGNEEYFQQFIRQAFFHRLKMDENHLNFSHIDMDTQTLDTLIDEAETLPFFGDERLIFVEQPYFLTSEKRNGAPEQNIERFIAYLNDPVPSTVLVFFANYEKLDERKKITKLLKKTSVVLDVKPPSDQEVKKMVQARVKEAKVDINAQALNYLLEATELNLSKIMRELDKLIIYANQTKTIDYQAVVQLIPKSLENNVFDLTQGILQGKTEQAIRQYRELVLQGEETIKINAILIGQVRLYLQVALLMKKGMQQGAIAQQVKAHPYRVKLAMQQVKKYTTRELMTLYDELVENDYQMKTGQMVKEYLFELFILKTTRQTA